MSDYGSYSGACGPVDAEIDPDATDDFEFNFAGDLDGDTIATVEFLLPDGLVQEDVSNNDTTATIFVSGAQCGRTYRITCRYTTAGGRSRDKTIRVIGRQQ